MVRGITATCLKPPAPGSDAGPQVAGECGEPQAAVPLLSVPVCLGPTEQQPFKLEANHHYLKGFGASRSGWALRQCRERRERAPTNVHFCVTQHERLHVKVSL